jgi:cytochrome c-type biogenesis protein CcmH/NrfG
VENNELKTSSEEWKSTHAYIMALVCLTVGISFGWFLHGPTSPQPGTAAAAAAPMQQASQPQMPPQEMAQKAAESVLDKLNKDPKNFDLLISAGELYYHHRAFQEAGGYYARALDVKESVPVRNQYASALYYSGDVDGALKQYSLVLKTDPKNDIALFNRGMVEFKSKNDARGAVESWKALLKAKPDHPQRAQVEKMIHEASEMLKRAS